jgi:hypothetical protein
MLFAAALYIARVHDAMPGFDAYHAAATRVLHGDSPYLAGATGPFTYMPALAIAMTPLALFELAAARFIWFTVSVGLLTVFIRWAIHGLPERRRSEDWLQWLTLVLMLPFYAQGLTAGQTDVLLGVLLMGSLMAVQVDLPRAGGILLGAAIVFEPYALLLLPWLAFAHGARAVVATGMVLAAGLILPALLFGWTGNIDMLVAWFRTVSDAPPGAERLVDGVSILTVLSTAAVLGLVTAVWVRRQAVFDPDYVECALIMLFIPLLSSSGAGHVFLLATPAVICLLDRWGETAMRWRVVTGLALVVMSVAAADQFVVEFRSFLTASGVMAAGALGVAVALVHLRWKALA